MKASSFFSLIIALGVGAAGGWYAREAGIGVTGELAKQAETHPSPDAAKKAESGSHKGGLAVAGEGKPVAKGPVVSAEARAKAFEEGGHMTIDLLYALEDHVVEAEFKGNGRDLLKMALTNRASQAVRLSLPQGQTFESVHGKVTMMHSLTLDLLPGETMLHDLETLALSSRHSTGGDAQFVAVSHPQGELQPLLEHLAAHPEIPVPVAQAAALAIRENLPASAFARFAQERALPSELNTDFFKVETAELVQALMLLRTLGYTEDGLAITIDPLTKIEAMVDPLAHAFALQYYRIEPQEEWAFWKRELLEGNVKTRHYALHGIARYYPDIALRMMPDWVREQKTSRIFRLTAAQALSLIPRPEALELLKALKEEFQDDSELTQTIAKSIDYLEATLRKTGWVENVAFRFSSAPSHEDEIAPVISETEDEMGEGLGGKDEAVASSAQHGAANP